MAALLISTALFGGSDEAIQPPPPPARERSYTGSLGGGFDTGSFNSGGSGRCFGGDVTFFVANSADGLVELTTLRVNGQSLTETKAGRQIKQLLQRAARGFVSEFQCLNPGSIRLTLTGRFGGRAGAPFSRSFTITYTPVPLGRERQAQPGRKPVDPLPAPSRPAPVPDLNRGAVSPDQGWWGTTGSSKPA